MKVLIVIEDDSITLSLKKCIDPLNLDLIRYRDPIKALDNLEEIEPDVVIISATDFPRHWKTIVVGVRVRPKEDCIVILLGGSYFSKEEKDKATCLGVNAVIDENLSKPDELKELFELINIDNNEEQELDKCINALDNEISNIENNESIANSENTEVPENTSIANDISEEKAFVETETNSLSIKEDFSKENNITETDEEVSIEEESDISSSISSEEVTLETNELDVPEESFTEKRENTEQQITESKPTLEVNLETNKFEVPEESFTEERESSEQQITESKPTLEVSLETDKLDVPEESFTEETENTEQQITESKPTLEVPLETNKFEVPEESFTEERESSEQQITESKPTLEVTLETNKFEVPEESFTEETESSEIKQETKEIDSDMINKIDSITDSVIDFGGFETEIDEELKSFAKRLEKIKKAKKTTTKTQFFPKTNDRMSFVFCNPLSLKPVTGAVYSITENNIDFVPDSLKDVEKINNDTQIDNSQLRIGDRIFELNCRFSLFDSRCLMPYECDLEAHKVISNLLANQ